MKAKVAKRVVPSLAAAKHLRALFESAAVRQKAHDARLDLQKRIKDHNFAIQQRMDAHRLRDMTRADTPLTARVARDMVAPRPRTLTPAPRAPPPPPRPQRFDLTPPPGPTPRGTGPVLRGPTQWRWTGGPPHCARRGHNVICVYIKDE